MWHKSLESYDPGYSDRACTRRGDVQRVVFGVWLRPRCIYRRDTLCDDATHTRLKRCGRNKSWYRNAGECGTPTLGIRNAAPRNSFIPVEVTSHAMSRRHEGRCKVCYGT